MKGKNVWFDRDTFFVEFENGQIIGNPIQRFPRLEKATAKDRARFRFMDTGIRWDDIDEDISFKGLFLYKNDILKEWNTEQQEAERVQVQGAKTKAKRKQKVFA